MHYKAVTHLIAFATVLSQAAGELVTTPRNTEARVGDTTYFNCSTNLTSEIFWHHGDNYIYTGYGILDPYQGRFEIDRNSSKGSHNLVIRSVKPSDAGEFKCIDDDGFGTKQSAELVVLEKEPECQSNIQSDGVIGHNTFGIPQDEVQLICNVSYYGRIPPEMEWKRVGDNNPIEYDVTTNVTANNHIIYTLRLKGDVSFDKSSYVCQTTRSAQNQYNCTSEIKKVLSFNGGNMIEQKAFIGETISCTVSRNTFPCINQWHHGNKTFGETIMTDLLGEYLCVVKCQVRGIDYSFPARKAFVVEAEKSSMGTVAAAVVVSVILIPSTVLVTVLAMKFRRRKSVKRAEVAQTKFERLYSFIMKPEETNVAKEEIELLHKVKQDGRASEENAILGVTILSGKLFLVHKNSSNLHVFDCSDFQSACQILIVEEVVAAFDICSCKKNDCLYIMNQNVSHRADLSISKENVIRLSAEGKYLGKWLTGECGFLSATAEGNVLITDPDKNKLLEYSYVGSLVHCMELSECKRPWHTIKLDNNRYIVSHGTCDHLNRVCLLDRRGNVLKFFGHEMGSTESQLHMPYYLAVTSGGCVLVADLCNNRVLLLNSNFEVKANIVPWYRQKFLSPRRICLDEALLVVVINSGNPKNMLRSLTQVEWEDTEKPSFHKNAMEEKIEDCCDKDPVSVENGVSRIKAEDGETSTATDALLSMSERVDIKSVDPSSIIEENCRVLVFDVKQLLQKYDRRRTIYVSNVWVRDSVRPVD